MGVRAKIETESLRKHSAIFEGLCAKRRFAISISNILNCGRERLKELFLSNRKFCEENALPFAAFLIVLIMYSIYCVHVFRMPLRTLTWNNRL